MPSNDHDLIETYLIERNLGWEGKEHRKTKNKYFNQKFKIELLH